MRGREEIFITDDLQSVKAALSGSTFWRAWTR
jgi:hypothetical protein